jgi:hypothetical protein
MTITILQISTMVLFVAAILFGGHYFLYYSLVKFFGIFDYWTKNILLALTILLPLSFFVSSASSHFRGQPLTSFFYIFSATWLGVAFCLSLACLAAWLLIFLSAAFNWNINSAFCGGVFLLIALAVSIFGIWNAFHPEVKNLEVKLKNLPLEWQGKIIVHLSDVHLGQIHGVSFLQDVVAKTNAQNPELVLITGDLFDGMDGDLGLFIELLKSIKAKQGVYFSTGNHETYLGLAETVKALEQADIKILDNEMVNLGGLQIIGISYPNNSKTSVVGATKNLVEIIAEIKNYDASQSSILMHHAPTDTAQAKKLGINLQLSGHSHVGQVWPFSYITRAIYGKYYYGLNSEGDYSIYTSSGVGTWGPPIRLGNTPEIVVFRIK